VLADAGSADSPAHPVAVDHLFVGDNGAPVPTTAGVNESHAGRCGRSSLSG